jgi:hypothetical protein
LHQRCTALWACKQFQEIWSYLVVLGAGKRDSSMHRRSFAICKLNGWQRQNSRGGYGQVDDPQ